MGGMAAQIPVRDDPEANAVAMARVREDKAREVRAGHDGTWVAHPGLIAVAREEFDAGMPGPNQIGNARDDVAVTADDLVTVPKGAITERGLRHNIDVGLRYLDAWLGGSGCVPIYNLMEDAATAEISRSQVWQWVCHRTQFEDGRTVTPKLVRTLMADVVSHLTEERMILDEDDQHVSRAAALLEEMMLGETLDEWLTTVAYEYLD
jgi:malate synthase